MDFGTGRASADDRTRTAGTPLYLAPELFAGEQRTVRSDIYSVGVLLYHLLTRSYPVAAQSMPELRRLHERGERRSLRSVRQDLPSNLADAIDRAIDSQPSRRHASAAELAASLIAPASGVRAGWWWAALAAVGVTIATAIAFSVGRGGPFWQARGLVSDMPGGMAVPTFAVTERRTDTGHAVGAGISPDGRFIVYVVDQAGSSSLWTRELATKRNHQIVPPAEVLYLAADSFARRSLAVLHQLEKRRPPTRALPHAGDGKCAANTDS